MRIGGVIDLDNLNFLGQLLFIALGVVASVLIPVVIAAWPKPPGSTRGFGKRLFDAVKPYLALAVGSVLIALVVLAILKSQSKELEEWWQALLAGYVSDSTLQKFKEGSSRRGD